MIFARCAKTRTALPLPSKCGSTQMARRPAIRFTVSSCAAMPSLPMWRRRRRLTAHPIDKARPHLETILKPLWETYACLKRGREDRGPLELDLPERKILLKEDGTVDRVIVPDRLDAHKLVEEFMIQANVCAAETLENKRQPLIFRTHDSPSLDKLETLGEFLKSLNMTLVRSGNLRAQHFNGILKAVEGKEHEELVNQVVLRSQSQAEYSPENIGHFGLNLRKYAHFTSPIRRYADLIVHRALVGALALVRAD